MYHTNYATLKSASTIAAGLRYFRSIGMAVQPIRLPGQLIIIMCLVHISPYLIDQANNLSTKAP